MSSLILAGMNLVAVGVLVFALYFPRHRRRDLAVAYLGVNVGVFAVASSLSTGSVGAGLGLGLFGVLSIIRLRSTELDQHEVAYYFSALALGILGPISGTSIWIVASLTLLILVVMFIGDHPRMLHRHRRHIMVLETALTDPVALTSHLEQLLGARVHTVNVERVDMVNDTTVVDVRYSRPKVPAPARRLSTVGVAR